MSFLCGVAGFNFRAGSFLIRGDLGGEHLLLRIVRSQLRNFNKPAGLLWLQKGHLGSQVCTERAQHYCNSAIHLEYANS
ncbi:hypothetical protein CHARACLAT_001304 [Characodon lateralis]|uniref:MHC class I antigen n=1 Tax=Characodon lateralis TaxID=208331 RepID=A0ABU7DPN8_9TELE|nr:hypothetical protein [Characodon lateralis]